MFVTFITEIVMARKPSGFMYAKHPNQARRILPLFSSSF